MALYKNYSKKEKKKRYLRDGIIMLVLLLLAITTLFPIYYMIISSFGEPVEAGAASYSILLRNPTLNSYKFFFDK